MMAFYTVPFVLILAACSQTPVINYEITEYGLPVACVDGENGCRELDKEYQRDLIREICKLYECTSPP